MESHGEKTAIITLDLRAPLVSVLFVFSSSFGVSIRCAIIAVRAETFLLGSSLPFNQIRCTTSAERPRCGAFWCLDASDTRSGFERVLIGLPELLRCFRLASLFVCSIYRKRQVNVNQLKDQHMFY